MTLLPLYSTRLQGAYEVGAQDWSRGPLSTLDAIPYTLPDETPCALRDRRCWKCTEFAKNCCTASHLRLRCYVCSTPISAMHLPAAKSHAGREMLSRRSCEAASTAAAATKPISDPPGSPRPAGSRCGGAGAAPSSCPQACLSDITHVHSGALPAQLRSRAPRARRILMCKSNSCLIPDRISWLRSNFDASG